MMKMPKIILLFFCFCTLFLSSVFAIDISRYRFHTMPETSYYGGIQSISKDSLGRIWYTGPDAVFMYDGNSFYQLNDLASASNPKVRWAYGTLITDKQGRLFLATNHGLLRFNYQNFKFDFIVPGKIRSVCLNTDGNLYMLSGDSVLVYDQKKSITKKYILPIKKYFNSIIQLNGKVYVSQENLLYHIGTQGKFVPFADFGATSNVVNDAVAYHGDYYFLTPRGGIFVTDANGTVKKNIPITAAGNQVPISKKIFIDQSGMMWVATQSGLFLYDPLTGSSNLLRMNLNDAFSLPNNSIWTIYGDPDQGAWIGTYGGKIAFCSLYDAYVRYFRPSPGALNHPVVSSFQEDNRGNIWIATEGGGLNYWNRQSDAFSHFMKSATNSISSNSIKKLRFDPERKHLYIASFNGGIISYQTEQKSFTNLNIVSPVNKQPLTVYDFVRDDQGTLWMTDPDKNFIYRKKSTLGAETEIIRITEKNKKPLDLEIEALDIDKEGNLRLVTHQGLYLVDPESLRVIKHYFISNGPYAINHLSCFYQAANGDVWLGTSGKGINVLKKDGRYLNFSSTNGFPPKMVFGILEDDASKNIWISTSEGLYYFDQKAQKFGKALFYQDNSCGSFYLKSAYKTQKGELIFGGTNGFMIFDPQYLNKNPQKPKVFFTGFLINNAPVTNSSDDSPLIKDISDLGNQKENRIRLSSNQSNIEIRFSSNSYLLADQNQFLYRMTGLSEKWQRIGTNQRAVHFFNLPGGNYCFEIKASNNDGLWGDEITRLYIHVNPPFFLSWWAYLIYSFLAIGLLFFIMRYFANKKVFKERLALEMQKEQHMRDLNQARTDFFTNISHDLKTPLTLVLEPLKQLKETVVRNEQASPYLQLIEKNVARIQRTISQLLRFREIESQKITLNPQVGDLISFIHDVFGLFELYANKKEIETNMSAHQDKLLVAFDYDIIEKILTNLFSNAIKYTPNKGYVGVRIYESTEEEKQKWAVLTNADLTLLSIEILNTSAGFSEDQIAQLFTAFNRLSSKRPTFEESSGLGLAIVKELVEALEGKIWMVNKNNQVAFTIMLPLKMDAGSADLQPGLYDYTISEIDDILLETEIPEQETRQAKKVDSLLLIDDDPALRSYLEVRLSEKFNVYTASDGAEGIVKAEKIYPQLIITDLMMPNTNGFEVCSHLRQNFKTSHIPVIMISGAGDENQNKIKALEHGATVFIDKPFEVEYLIQQIENILKNQQEMREMYSKRLVVDPANVTITSMDEELLTRAMKFIEQNMDNPNYSVDDFVSDMNTGRTILYQKINDIVGMSIKEFILNIRLKRSAYLLEHSDLTVAEVAYQTGFNNAKYFSVCFKKQLDVSPSEFKKRFGSEL